MPARVLRVRRGLRQMHPLDQGALPAPPREHRRRRQEEGEARRRFEKGGGRGQAARRPLKGGPVQEEERYRHRRPGHSGCEAKGRLEALWQKVRRLVVRQGQGQWRPGDRRPGRHHLRSPGPAAVRVQDPGVEDLHLGKGQAHKDLVCDAGLGRGGSPHRRVHRRRALWRRGSTRVDDAETDVHAARRRRRARGAWRREPIRTGSLSSGYSWIK
mmetsp:Transcript_32791/g.110486  ORF Transcript_32791/g.110486 Transcript_32791/m.110486 type:complete len:214 (-) Transcript_32791:572-1213(-)